MAVSISAKGADPRHPRAGFTLFEALIALVVAGFLLPVLGRALAGAWQASQTPLDIVSAMTLARDAASDLGPADAPGYRVTRTSNPVVLEEIASGLPPAPMRSTTGKDPDGLDHEAVPIGIRLTIPKSFNSAAPAGAPPPTLVLRQVSVIVTTPRGRRVGLDAIRLDASRP